MSNIKTTIHIYNFDTSKPSERAQWEALRDSLTAKGLHVFESHGGGSHWLSEIIPGTWKDLTASRTIELETTSLFENQWNTAPIEGISKSGLRVFDWALDYKPNDNSARKRGHWLEQTSEMSEVRRNTVGCGYCGKQEPAAKGYVFCPHCLDSEYLTASDLPLTRMRPICDERPRNDRAPLTDAERAHLLPLFNAAQLYGTTERGKKRIAKARADIEHKLASDLAKARAEHAGATWIMDNVPGLLANCIYYSHTGKHSFGWRKPLEGDILSELLDKISEFPGAYEIKCADGRTLSAT